MGRPEAAWLEQLSSGDPSVRDVGAAELREFLARTLSRGFGHQFSDADIDDLAQESMVRVQDNLDSFGGRSRFTTWAAAIAVNLALGALRKRKYREVSLEAAVDTAASAMSTDGPAHISRTDVLLNNAIDEALTERQRTALLAELGGLPMAEIAHRFDTSRGALYKLLHDARKRLRAYFDDKGITLDELLPADPGGAR